MPDPLMPPLGVNEVHFGEPAPPPVPAMVDTVGVPPKAKLTPLGEEMQQEFLQQQSLTAVNLLRAVRKSPDDTARDLVVARDLGLPPNLVAGNKDLRAQAKAERIKGDIASSPVLQKRYSDEDFAAIAQDDSTTFSKLQNLIGSTAAYVMGATPSGGAPGAIVGGLYPLTLRASSGVGRFATEVGAAGLAYLGADGAAKTLAKGAKSFAETAAWAQDKLDSYSAENPGFVQAAVDSGMQSVGQFSKYAPLMFTGPAGVLAAIGLMAVEAGGITYTTDREKNLGIARSAAHATADATWEAAGEILLGVKGFAKLLTSGGTVAKLLRYEMTNEVAGEVLTTLGQNFNEWALVNPGKSAAEWAKEQPAAALSTVISTVVTGGVQAGAGRGAVKFIQDVMSREILSSESTRQANALEGMLKTALDVQTRTRSPEAFRAAVQEMAEGTDGAATSVFVESVNFEQLPPEDLALLPQAIKDQIGASTESTLIEVQMGDVLTVAPGTALEQFFTEHGKIGSPEALSRAEAKQASATAAEWLQSRADEILQNAVDQEASIAAHEKMVGNIATQIAATGAFDADTNRSLAKIAGAFYTAMGSHFGASAVTLAQEFPLTVKTADRAVALTGVSQTAAPAATPETFTAAGVGDLLKTSNWSVMTAENPGGQDAGSAANTAANAAMRKELADAGYTVVDVQGSYGRRENSFVVLGITPKQALHYGRKYGQESVLAPQGLVYQDGTVTPATGVTVHPAAPADFYTTLPDGTTFTVDLDFDVEKSQTLEQPGPVTAAPAVEYGQPRRNSISVIGVHFGKTTSTILHASKYGTGLKGAERARLAGESDLQNRIYFYVNEGSGVSPETGVGPNASAVVLNNVYDSAADPLQIYTTDTNTFERAVMAAGFDGYYARGAFGKQGVAVLLGQHTVQTEALADPADAAGYELPPAIELSPVRQFKQGILKDDRLLFGLMKEADVKKLAPDLHQKMLDLGAKFDPKATYYRSDLAKLVPDPAGGLEQPGVAQTNTPEFKAWFGDSKVVDENGAPLVVYHGTGKNFAAFDEKQQGATFSEVDVDVPREGFWFATEPDRAQWYASQSAKGKGGNNLLPVFLSIKNPYIHTAQAFADEGLYGLPDATTLQRQGYDGIIVERGDYDDNDNVVVEGRDFAAFEPTQIKSAIGNKGSFDPNNPSILEQATSYARARFSPQDLSITLTPDADFNTFNHEMSHFFLTVMSRLAQRTDAPESLKVDMKILGDWFASKGSDFLMSEIARYQQNYEKRAVALEKSEPGSENTKAARRQADRTAAAYDYVVMNGGGLVMTKACYDLGASVPEEFRLDITRPMQEAFAEAGERYFLEGKAPTKELRSVFRRFVKMATDAMRRIRQTIPLSDEVRGVFDRALGAEAAVQAAAERAGMTADEAASGSATEKLRARSMRDLKWGVKARSAAIKDMQKSAAAQRAATEEEVRADVEQRPLYRAIRWLRKGETVDPETGDAVKAGKGFRLDARALVGMYPESGLNRPDLEKLKGMTQRDGLSPEIVAEMFGYDNGDALVRALAAADAIGTVIETETNQRMLEEHGDLIDQKSIEDAANEAVHNELRRRQMANELKSQMEALATRRDTGRTTKAGSRVTVSILQEAAARFANSIIENVPLARLRAAAREHLAAEKAAAKRWQEAYTKTTGEKDPGVKPFQEAVKAKQDQLLHNSAAKAALEAISETNKTLKFFKYVLRDNNEKLVKNGRDPDIVNAARVLLSAYGLGGRKERISASYMELVKINDPTLYETLQAAVDATDAVPVEELTFPELQELHANVEALWTLAKRSREVEVEGKKIALEEATTPLAERLDKIGVPERIPGEKWAVTPGEKRRSVLKFARALQARMEQWVEGIDGRYGGPFRKFVYQPIKTAADNFRAEKILRLKELEALGKTLSPHVRRGVIAAPELGYEFGRGKGEMGISELLHAILHTGNESNKRKLLLGREWGSVREDGSLDTSKWDGFVDRLIKEGVLKKEHFDYAQGVWDLLESTKARAQQAHREVFGRYFDEVTAQSFETPWGTYRGGYVPAKADPRLAKDADLRALAEREKDNMRFVLPTTQKGFTKARVEYNVPLLLDLTSLSQHIHQVLLFSHMEAAGRDVSKILRAGEVSGRLSRINEKAIPELITPWLNGSVKQLVSTPTVGDQSMARVANVVRMRTAMSFMFANVSNVMQQPSGFLTAWAKLRSDNLRSDMLRATATYLSNPRQLSAEVANQSQFMADRMAHEIYSMNDTIEKVLLDPSLYETATRWTTQHAYFLQAALENVMGPIIWTAGYNGHYAKHGNETEAVQYADSLIRQTLGSSLPEDISRLERSNAYVKPFVMFFGYFSMLANTNIAMVQKTVDELGVRKGAGRSVGLVTVGGLAALWFAEAVTVAMRGGPEDPDDDGYLDDWILAVLGLGTIKGVTAMVPFVGQAAIAGFNTWNDKPYDDRMSVSPVVAGLEALVRTPVSVYKAIVGEGKVKKAVNDLSSALTILTGLPIAGVTRGVGYAAGVAEDEIVPTSNVDLVRGLIQGSASPESRVR